MSGNRYLLSAYGLAVKHGFTGTEEDFLRSLVGPQGPPGKTPEWDYYQTEREELDAAFPYHLRKGYEDLHKRINRIGVQYVYNLYDALDDKYVQKKDLKDYSGNVVLREYVIKCNTVGMYTNYADFKADDPARKPKYLIVTGIHGTERNAVFFPPIVLSVILSTVTMYLERFVTVLFFMSFLWQTLPASQLSNIMRE